MTTHLLNLTHTSQCMDIVLRIGALSRFDFAPWLQASFEQTGMALADSTAMQPADPIQIEKLVELYYRPLFRFAARLCGSPVEALTLTQNTFRHAFDISQFLPVPANVRGWLFAILFHSFLERRASLHRT